MSKTQMINLGRDSERWLKLMLHLQNSLPGVFRCMFDDEQTARTAAHRMCANINRHPSWFNMVVCQRGCEVYVIKTQYVQKVMIRE